MNSSARLSNVMTRRGSRRRLPAPPQPSTAAADQLSQVQLSMCKTAQPNMSSENSNQYGFNISILHGFSFGSGAMTVLLIVGLGLLWLKCRKKQQNSAMCSTCHQGPPAPPQPLRPASLAIEMVEPSSSSFQPLPNPGGRLRSEEEVIKDFLQFSRSQAHGVPTAPESNPYMLHQ